MIILFLGGGGGEGGYIFFVMSTSLKFGFSILRNKTSSL